MKKIIILLLCCGVFVSMVGCGGNTAPPTESTPTTAAETVITETPLETTPPVTAVEPTEKEKEPVHTESKEQATEQTVISPITTKKPTEEQVERLKQLGIILEGKKRDGKQIAEASIGSLKDI